MKGQQEMADTMGVSLQYIQQRVESLCEHNPMLGHRGCRLGNTYPEITQMQTRYFGRSFGIEERRSGNAS